MKPREANLGIGNLLDRGVELWVEGDAVRCRAPKGAMSSALRQALGRHKPRIVARLGRGRKYAPLSFAQQRLWLLDQLDSSHAAYNIAWAFRLRGSLDAAVLARALAEIVRRHETLRTTFTTIDDRAVQVIDQCRTRAPRLPVVDLGRLPAAARETEATRRARAQAGRRFNLSAEPLLRASLVRLDSAQHLLLLAMHHIVSDGWSVAVFHRELTLLYEAFASGRASPLPELPMQYTDFAVGQRRWLRGEVRETQLAYWREPPARAPSPLRLPTDRPRPTTLSYRGTGHGLALSDPLSESLRRLSIGAGASLFITLLSAFMTLLHRITGQREIVVGAPVANRNRPEIEGLIGFFVNTLVMRGTLAGEASFRELLAELRETALGAYEHQDLPFERLVEELQPEREAGRNPLFQVILALQNAPEFEVKLPGLVLSSLPETSVWVRFDLELHLWEPSAAAAAAGLEGQLNYSTELFDATTIGRMAEQYRTLLREIAANPDAPLRSLPLLSKAGRHQLLEEWSVTGGSPGYPRHLGLHQLFETLVEQAPEAVAVVLDGPDRSLTFGELNRRANQLAHHLRDRGVGPETLVGLCVERSPELMICLLAILKAGGAYVPLDPAYPHERLAFMLQDTGISLLLVQQALAGPFLDVGPEILCLETDRAAIARASCENPNRDPDPRNLAYVMFTSGSTGRPKGVSVTHRGVIRLVRENQYARLGPDEVFLQMASISFDASTLEIWGSLLNLGRLVVMPPPEPSLAELGRTLRRHRVTTLWLTTALFHLMVDVELADLRGIRQLLTGGEVLSPSRVRTVLAELPDCTLVNAYGPTESTTFTSACPIRHRAPLVTPVPIGRPIAATRVYLVDRSPELVPIGSAGELWIGGDGLARSYWRSPALSAEKFVPDPFTGEPGKRLYRTGDLVRHLSDGRLEFLGRIDHQVKIRGFRIEPGEIEAVLASHPGVKEAVVLVREVTPGDKRLVAYAVPKPHAAAAGDALADDLCAFLREKLPEFMVPSACVLLESLPLGPSGKVDRAALHAPESERPEPEAAFAAPRTPIEEILAGIWSRVLGVDQVGRHDNIFELGGHSLLATQIISRVRQTFRVELPLRHLFESPTVAELARVIAATRHGEALRTAASPPLEQAVREAEPLLSFAQQRLWFLHQLDPGSPAYNIPAAFRLTGRLEPAVLEACFREIVRRHETLRTTFPAVGGRPIQAVAPTAELVLPLVDLAQLPERALRAETRRLACRESGRPFDLERGPVLRVALLRLGRREHFLLVTVHHIVSDGWSQGVFYRELAVLYEAFSTGKRPGLPELPIQYADFAIWQRQRLSGGRTPGEVLETQLAYWRTKLGGELPVLRLPTDRPRPAVPSRRGAMATLELNEGLTAALRKLSLDAGATLYMTLLAAFMALLHRLTGQRDLVVGSPIANRNHREIEGLIGFFVNTLVMRGQLTGDRSLGFPKLLERIREAALEAYDHQDLPFERVVEELDPERDIGSNPLFQVMFALQNAPSSEVGLPGLRLTPIELKLQRIRFDLEVHLWETDGGNPPFVPLRGNLRGLFLYSTDLFDATTIARLVDHFECLLEAVAADPEHRLAELPAASPPVLHHLLLESNDTRADYPAHACLHRVFEAQAERTPDAVAVEFADRRLSYRELDRRADGLARHLRDLGVGTETRVGVSVERSPEMVISLLGILKAGGAYVPLDPAYPPERLTFMLDDAGISVLLTQKALRDRLPERDAQVVCLETIEPASPGGWDPPAAQNLAYVMYTSGSTGRPKGVCVTHRGVLRLVRGIDYVRLTPDEVFLQLASISFDASTLEIWGCLLGGGRLVVMPPQLPSLEDLGRFLIRRRISTLWLTAGLFHQMVDRRLDDLSGLGQLLAGGDVLSPRRVRRVLDELEGSTLTNGYGPTECTTFTCCHPMRRGRASPTAASVAIGRPIANTRVYLVDRVSEPVAMGAAGELRIGGDGLARGYLHRPALTAEKFVPNPFAEQPGERLYRSGDLVRSLPDGTLEFLGRIDHQVKIRGYRVELGEIEAALTEHPAVGTAVVVAHEESGRENDKRLVAYLAQDPGYRDAADAEREEWQQEYVGQWRELYEDLYGPGRTAPDPDGSFNTVGWESSYTGQAFPAEEMREWLDHTIERILSLRPFRVLEIGSGTGLLLYRIAPHCAHYLGTDISRAALDGLRTELASADRRLAHVELACKSADDFTGIEAGAFDTVILNSVVQYFPSIDYLLKVLRGAVEATAPGGSIFVGDVRSLPLLEACCASVELYQ
ncbi:MAG: amino acid adenylation domain-containing protein, partial [bacterium]|nr:amino acid adenylation domain-containing protein [bacterium]